MQVAAIFIALFASAFGVFYMFYVTRNKERMALIEQGADASLFKTTKEPRERRNFSYIKFTLKFGMFLIGLGIGFIFSVLFVQAIPLVDQDLFTVGSVFVFGGLGLVIGYFVGLRIDKNRAS